MSEENVDVEGLITRRQAFWTRQKALEAAGLSEELAARSIRKVLIRISLALPFRGR